MQLGRANKTTLRCCPIVYERSSRIDGHFSYSEGEERAEYLRESGAAGDGDGRWVEWVGAGMVLSAPFICKSGRKEAADAGGLKKS